MWNSHKKAILRQERARSEEEQGLMILCKYFSFYPNLVILFVLRYKKQKTFGFFYKFESSIGNQKILPKNPSIKMSTSLSPTSRSTKRVSESQVRPSSVEQLMSFFKIAFRHPWKPLSVTWRYQSSLAQTLLHRRNPDLWGFPEIGPGHEVMGTSSGGVENTVRFSRKFWVGEIM